MRGRKSSDVIYYEDNLPEPTVDKAARVAIDNLILAAARRREFGGHLQHPDLRPQPGRHRDSVQLPRLLKQARKSGVVPRRDRPEHLVQRAHRRRVALYLLALSKNVPGTFYFVESGEASFIDMTTAMAEVLKLGKPQDWALKDAEAEWGYEMANYGLGSNSRVRGKHARALLGWVPKRRWLNGFLTRWCEFALDRVIVHREQARSHIRPRRYGERGSLCGEPARDGVFEVA
jgi:hypothetical protein